MLIEPGSRYTLQMIPQHKSFFSVAIRVANMYGPGGELLVTRGNNHVVHSWRGEKED